MNRKDFLKLLGAAPLVGLAKYLKPEAIETTLANRPISYPLYEGTGMTIVFDNNTDRDIVVNSFSIPNDFQVGDIVNVSETETGYHAAYKIKSIDSNGDWNVVIVSADEA